MKKGLIEIDEELVRFHNYLKNEDRIIFSARFGDGKTTFLDKYKKKYSESIEYITLYPLNYQVADNKDIFEYIKRDIFYSF